MIAVLADAASSRPWSCVYQVLSRSGRLLVDLSCHSWIWEKDLLVNVLRSYLGSSASLSRYDLKTLRHEDISKIWGNPGARSNFVGFCCDE